jgi:diacylglycerol kinase family enzyme
MTRSACLIFNPVAGQGDSDADLEQIRSLLESEIDLDIQFTTPEVDAGQLKQLVRRF